MGPVAASLAAKLEKAKEAEREKEKANAVALAADKNNKDVDKSEGAFKKRDEFRRSSTQ